MAAALLMTACFGDNSDGGEEGEPPDGAPSILEIAGPDELDLGDGIDLTVKVKGKANEQLSVAIDGMLGTFSPQNKVVITDNSGEALFSTRYNSGGAPGLDTVTVNVSALDSSSRSSTKALTVHDVERFGNVTPVGAATAQASGILIAYPMVLTSPRIVRKLGITHPTQPTATPVNAQIGLYSTDTATSVNVIAKTTAMLTPGANEITIPPAALEVGKYWMVVAYSGTPDVYRSATEQVVLLYKTAHVYSQGLADKITGLSTSDTVAPYYARNFYLVLRK